ncbi:peptidase [Verrucomicrobia bacterium LW23]|nr:peptidase [Verrucomicrobia bacterium LW23]
MKRLAGLETEYGCLVPDSFGLPTVPVRVKEHLFKKHHVGLIDLHDRDYDEPAGNGGFLYNGGRLYLDMGHVEYCTPECLSLADVVAYDRAGEELLQLALHELGLAHKVSFIKNNIDHYTSATFGCHENYLLQRDAPLHQRNVDTLLAFLSTRILLVGAGRVGVTLAPRRYGKQEPADQALYQISQRADFIQTDIYEWVQFNRALINARDEPLADYRRFRRLHLLLGDSNVLPYANALKVGTSALVLDLLEADALPKISLVDPVRSMRQLSHHPDGPWTVELTDGEEISALDVQEAFLTAARSGAIDLDADARWTIDAWESALLHLRAELHTPGDGAALIGKLDWITKRFLLSSFIEAEGKSWRDPWIESLDLEYHQLNVERSLIAEFEGYAMQSLGLKDLAPAGDGAASARDYTMLPPPDTRAAVRSEAMHVIAEKKLPYMLDWDLIYVGEGRQILLEDPFSTELAQLEPLRAAVPPASGGSDGERAAKG